MRVLVGSALAVTLFLPATSWAAINCPDRAPGAIASAAAASAKCQATIAKAGLGFVKAKLKAQSKCVGTNGVGPCPDTKASENISKAELKAAAKITADCALDSAQAGLASSTYAASTDDTVITSCVLSQHNATADILVGEFNGATGAFVSTPDHDKCVKTISKTGIKQATGAHNYINKCLGKQIKLGTAGDLTPVCVGSYAGGAFVPPTDPKTAAALAKLEGKTVDALTKGCIGDTATYIPNIFACPGSSSVADLEACLVCDSWDAVVDNVEQENAESGTLVANGPGALQAAVTAAAPGAKLLIASGDYAEQVVIATNGLQLVGCGGATGDRPNVVRPVSGGPYGNGIAAGGVDGLLFQSLDLTNWDDNGVFISNANGVTFRDVHADGQLNSTYGIFPVTSNNVVVEGSSSANVRDAGIYIGQSTNILSRYNKAIGNVAGMEIENSQNATVHNNYCADNSGGLLVFKLPGLPVQLSNNHHVFDNVSLHNNTPNFGIPGSTVASVPTGTGMLIISNDDGVFDHNVVMNNNSLGIALVDQEAINALIGSPLFFPTSIDQKAERNKIHNNQVISNGAAPASPVGGNVLLAIIEDTLPHGNCFHDNVSTLKAVLGVNDCP